MNGTPLALGESSPGAPSNSGLQLDEDGLEAAQWLISSARLPRNRSLQRLREVGLAAVPAAYGDKVDRVVGAASEVVESALVQNVTSLLWLVLQFTIGIHVVWLAAWLLLIVANGRNSPSCLEHCTMGQRVKESLPWQTPDALFFYILLYLLLLIYTYYLAVRRWLYSDRQLPIAMRAWKLVVIILVVPAFLNHAFWKIVIETYANVQYLDWDPSAALLDRPSQPATISLPNGTAVALRAGDAILVGNGPLGAEHRAFLRAASPSQIYRFNGMTNLLPDEPVGHLFVRRVTETFDLADVPSDYWGLAPPLRRRGVLEWLYVPASTLIRQRTMCHRAPEALDITLLNGLHDDAAWYAWQYGLPMRLPECDGLCREVPPAAGGVKAPGGWTSGFLGLLEVLQLKPAARIHLLGMNFGAAPNQQHATHVERRFVQMLVDKGRVLMHRSPSALYHTEFVASAANVAHLGFPKTLFVTENRVQGMSCGDWNVWWFPEWQWSPQRWYGAWPLPPYFHPGTELHVADADGNTLPSDYDPLNCTQHAELLARGVGGGGGSRHNGRRLSGRQLFSLRRFMKMKTGIKLYGGPLSSNVSMQLESIEECEGRVALVRKYEEDFHMAAPSPGAGVGGGDSGDRGGGSGSGSSGAADGGSSSEPRPGKQEARSHVGHGGHGDRDRRDPR